MLRHNQHAYNRGGCRGYGGSCHAHAERIDKYIIQHNICEASHDHSRHGQAGRAVIPDKTQQNIISQEERGKYEEDADIVRCISDRIGVCSEESRDLRGKQRSGRTENNSRQDPQIQRVCKNGTVNLIAGSRGRQCIAGGRAHADHQTGAVHQAVGRKNQIQRGQRVSPDASGNEKGVCQDIAGIADHSKNIGRYIFQKNRENLFRRCSTHNFLFLSCNRIKKAFIPAPAAA